LELILKNKLKHYIIAKQLWKINDNNGRYQVMI